MTKTMQQLWDYALFLLFSGGETKDYLHRTACIMKYGAVRKFSQFGCLIIQRIQYTIYDDSNEYAFSDAMCMFHFVN